MDETRERCNERDDTDRPTDPLDRLDRLDRPMDSIDARALDARRSTRRDAIPIDRGTQNTIPGMAYQTITWSL